MKAVVIFNDGSEIELTGKDLRITRDAACEYHITDAYHDHRLCAAYSNVKHISLVGKPKERKVKPAVETLTVNIDTTKLQACIKEAMLELEGLADSERFIHKDQLEDYVDKNVSNSELCKSVAGVIRAERDELKKELAEARATIEQLAFVPADVATAAQLLDAELLVYLDHVKNGQLVGLDPNQDIHFGNGIRFAIGKLTGNPVPFAQVPFNPPAKPEPAPAPAFQTTAIVEDTKLIDALNAPLPSRGAKPDLPLGYRAADPENAKLIDELRTPEQPCTCPPKRNTIDRGHMGSCPRAQEQWQPEAGESDTPIKE